MKYKFDIWYTSAKGNPKFLDTIETEADSERDAFDDIAQVVTDRTEIEVVHKPVIVSVSKIKAPQGQGRLF